MPGIAHIITGVIFATLLYNADPKRYSKKHAIIFAVMCMLGPDYTHAISFSNFDHRLGHSILGWPIYCLYLVPIFVFITRFTADFKIRNLTDEGHDSKNILSWVQVYFLLVAGGIFHFSVDIVMETKRFWPLPLDDPVFLNVLFFREDITDWSLLQIDSSFMTIVFYLLMGVLFFFFMKGLRYREEFNNNSYLNKTVGLIVAIYMVLFVLFGNFSSENDFGALAFFGLFFFIPFALNLLSCQQPQEASKNKKNSKNSNIFIGLGISATIFLIIITILEGDEIFGNIVVILRMLVCTFSIKLIDYQTYDDSKAELKLKICTFGVFIMGLILVLLPIIAVIFFYEEILLIEFVGENIVWMAIVLVLFGIFFAICANLLRKRKILAQKLLLIPLLLTGIVYIPLMIWLILREKEVLELFEVEK